MDTRRLQDAMYATGDAVERAHRVGLSQPSRSPIPIVRPERVLSLDAVMDDMRAILWPDRYDEESAEIAARSRQMNSRYPR